MIFQHFVQYMKAFLILSCEFSFDIFDTIMINLEELYQGTGSLFALFLLYYLDIIWSPLKHYS